MHANKGTIFLDEIGEMSPMMQAKLLRTIQEREIQRVGSDKTLAIDVRIIAATNRNLEEEVTKENFREDLYYRLNVVTLKVPPLRDRMDDIPLLAQHFLEKYAEKNRKHVKGFSPQAMDMLIKYGWPGNVRELENAIERAVILLVGEHITDKELTLTITQAYPDDGTNKLVNQKQIETTGRTLDEIERETILAALETNAGNKSETAKQLGINRKTLHVKLKKYGVS
jgi:two-component system response regulator HydG